MTPLRVTARLASPLAGDPPHLDSLLEFACAPEQDGLSRYQVDRNYPAPEQGAVAIPLARTWVGPWLVSHCSAPIFAERSDVVEHFAKRVAGDHVLMLDARERKTVSTTAGDTKSYRMPLRIRTVDSVVWFCRGEKDPIERAIRGFRGIGKKVSIGYGAVAEWTVEDTEDDYSWFADKGGLPVLMRPLPRDVGDVALPGDLVGYVNAFGACSPPYWHYDRFTEIIKPC